jgi:tRNA wybutosine-synthesizing protein 3
MSPSSFDIKKQKILATLSQPDEEYTDLSPKGSVDAAIRDLIAEINEYDGLVTTSSCAGRVSVFLEGKKKVAQAKSSEPNAEAGPTGKGGGKWLFVSHDPVTVDEEVSLHTMFGLVPADGTKMPDGASLVHFKFEPMVCASFQD